MFPARFPVLIVLVLTFCVFALACESTNNSGQIETPSTVAAVSEVVETAAIAEPTEPPPATPASTATLIPTATPSPTPTPTVVPPTATPAPTGTRLGAWTVLRSDGEYVAILTESVRGNEAALFVTCYPDLGIFPNVHFDEPFNTLSGLHEVRISTGGPFETQIWRLIDSRQVVAPENAIDRERLSLGLRDAQEFQIAIDLELDPLRSAAFALTGINDAIEQVHPCDASRIEPPLATPTAMPTPVSAPTATPAPQPLGLGVDRQTVMEAFEDPTFGFEFENSPLLDGTPRVLGLSPEGAWIELIGPPHNLAEASVSFEVSTDDYINTINGLYMLLLIQTVTSWQGQDSINWLTDATLRIFDEVIISRTYNGYSIRLIVLKESQVLVLEINR